MRAFSANIFIDQQAPRTHLCARANKTTENLTAAARKMRANFFVQRTNFVLIVLFFFLPLN